MSRIRLKSRFRRATANELARGYAAIGSGTAVGAISHIGERLLIAGMLGAAGLGELSIVMGLAGVVQQFFDLRVGQFSTQYGTDALTKGEKERAGAVFKLSYLLDGATGLVGFAFIFISAEWLTHTVVHQPQLTNLLQLYAVVGLVGTLDGTSDAILKAASRYRAIAVYGMAMPALELLLVGIALLSGGDLRAVIWSLILKDTIGAAIHVVLARQAVKAAGVRIMTTGLGILRDRTREYVKLIFHTNLIGYSRLVVTKLDAIVLGRYASLDVVGLYRLAISAATIVALAAEPLRGTLLQVFVRNLDKGRATIMSVVKRATVFGGGLVGLTGVALFLSGPAVFQAVVGTEAEEIKLVLLILIVAQVTNALAVWSGPLLFAQKRPQIVGTVALGTLVVYPLLLVAGVRALGSVGAALAYLEISLGTSAYAAIAALRHIGRGLPDEGPSLPETLSEPSITDQ